TIDTKDGKTCSVDLKLHTCTAKSKGQIRYLATGYIWFNYNDKVSKITSTPLNLLIFFTDTIN
ncbi:hypothetical protein EV421DRAFT_1826478, partial [Armillaria borealis]